MADSKTAIERLRELLDERGVEHSDFASAYRESTRWKDQHGRIVEHQLRKDADFGDTGIVRNLTPEQAIAATLGALEPHSNQHEPSHWYELFGTPEKTAWTLAKACGECDEDLPCCECPLYPIVGRNVYEPEILEWLRGDA